MGSPIPIQARKRRDKELDEVSTAIHGGVAAVNVAHNQAKKVW